MQLLSSGERYEVCFMYVVDFKKLFFCMHSHLENLERLQLHLNTDHFLSRTIDVHSSAALACGELVVVFFEYDENWYRAIVLEPHAGANRAKVFFVDYGNEVTCSLQMIRKLDNSQMTHKDDHLMREPYKINYAELNINENVLNYLSENADQAMIDHLKETLEGKPVFVKVLHAQLDEIINVGKYKSAKLENCLPKYLVNVYMAEDESDSDRKLFQMLDLAKIEALIQKPKSLPSLKETAPKRQFVKMELNKVYKTTMQFFEPNDCYVYFALKDNLNALNALQDKLQEETAEDVEFTYVKSLECLSVGQQLEALFSDDNLWYRVIITEKGTGHLVLFFADFGNSEKVSAEDLVDKNCLRERVFLRSAPDDFNMDYQALKCAYRQPKNADLLNEFLGIFENENDGFLSIRVTDILIEDGEDTPVYLFELAESAGEEDREVSAIFEKKKQEEDEKLKQAQEKVELYERDAVSNDMLITELAPSDSYQVAIVHHENVNEFYVHLDETVSSLIRSQQLIQILMNKIVKNNLVELNGTFEIGDYVLAKTSYDLTWNRAIVVSKPQGIYEVLYVDYGNRELLTNENIMSIFDLNAVLQHRFYPYDRVRDIIEMPFQAVLCQLGETYKSSSRNTETLKLIIGEYPAFRMRIKKKSRKMLCDPETNPGGICYLNRYAIDLFTDDQLLNDRFESLKVDIGQNALNGEQFYTCRISFAEKFDEFFVHLDHNMELLDAIQDYLNQPENCEHFKRFPSSTGPNKGDFVVAKFDEKWYRARVTHCDHSAQLYEVFFVDYGNVEKAVPLDDLRQFAFDNEALVSYEICNLSAMAYLIDLHEVRVDLERDAAVLDEIMAFEVFCVQIKDASDAQEPPMSKYSVEIYDEARSKCFNYYFTSMLTPITGYNQTELTLGDTLNAEFTFTEGIDSPVYFCTENDVAKRDKLDADLMAFYTENTANAELSVKNTEIQANSFYAFLHNDMWFRVLTESVDAKANKVKLFFLDYGESLQLELSELKDDNFKQLDKRFYSVHRFAFPVSLCDLSDDLSEVVLNQRMSTYPDYDAFIDVVQKYVARGEANLEKKMVKMKMNSVIENQNVEQQNDFMLYLVEIVDMDSNESLNRELKMEYIRSKRAKRYLQFKFEELPKKSAPDSATNLRIFAKRIDCFYLFNEEEVAQIQDVVFELCSHLLSTNTGALASLENKPMCGDLVLAKSSDDDEWYRGLITNHSEDFDRYEVVFVDFGNTEIVTSADILAPVEENQLDVFRNYAPQALACRLYPFAGPFDEKKNAFFKDAVCDRLLRAQFIRKSEITPQVLSDDSGEDIYMSLLPVHDVHLMVVTDNNNVELDVQDYLVKNKIGNLFFKKKVFFEGI